MYLFASSLFCLLVFFIPFLSNCLLCHFLVYLFTLSLSYVYLLTFDFLSTRLFSSLLSRLLVDMFVSLLVPDYGLDNNKLAQFTEFLGVISVFLLTPVVTLHHKINAAVVGDQNESGIN